MTTQTRHPARNPSKLSLLGGFSLIVNESLVTLPLQAQRVLAYLSIVQPSQPTHLRSTVAERLWDGVIADRSHASLRTAVWRIRQADHSLVHASRETLRLNDAVDVDVRRGSAQASRLLDAEADLQPHDADVGTLLHDLLPTWDEDWLLLERERIRQVQVHALEALVHRLRRLGRHAEAIEAAYAAISHEPLRESAHAALIQVFLDEGDIAQARRQLRCYASMLWSELGIRPSAELTSRVAKSAGSVADHRGEVRPPQTPAAASGAPRRPAVASFSRDSTAY